MYNDRYMTLFKVPDEKTLMVLNDNKNTDLKIHYFNNFSDKIEVYIQNNTDEITFHVFPKQNLQVAFYLYKDGVRIDTQGYSKNFTYTLK